MKQLLFLSTITFLSFTKLASAGELNLNKFTCSGDAEYGKIIINEVSVDASKISITYTQEVKLTLDYILTEKIKNGFTDANRTAYFIGATKSGDVNDFEDMSMPHLGTYKNGKIGSEITFNINGQRVFGTVNCK